MGSVTSPEAERRGHIIDSTIRVLARDGVAATSLSRVAREARVAKGIICYYFKSKDQLYDAVLSHMREGMVAAAAEEAENADDAWERVAVFISTHLTHMSDRRTDVLALRQLASTSAGGSPITDHLSVWQEHRDWLAGALTEGQEVGAFKDFDADLVATAISGAMENALLQWAHDPEVDLDQRAEQLLALFEPGLREDTTGQDPTESPLRTDQASISPQDGTP